MHSERGQLNARNCTCGNAEATEVKEMRCLEQRLFNYQVAMSVARTMLVRGFISKNEYVIIDTIIAKRHRVSLYSIFSDKP